MPKVDVFGLMDPELVLPSAANLTNIAFWSRLSDWSADRRPRVGPGTLSALHVLLGEPPTVPGLAAGDFWRIVGKIVSRGYDVAEDPRPFCEVHLAEGYRPSLGGASNLDLLSLDLSTAPSDTAVALATVSEVWIAPAHRDECEACNESPLRAIEAPSGTDALAWRAAYTAKAPTNIGGIASYADRMFPRLKFAPSAWDGVGSLSGDPVELVSALMKHLGVLNDHAAAIWSEKSGAADRQASMSALGVLCSPESPSVHRDKAAMRRRRINFEAGDEPVLCEWHTKVHATDGRIYFAIDQNAVLVGAVTSHL